MSSNLPWRSSPTSRRLNDAPMPRIGRSAWTLRIMAVLFVWPFLLRLLGSNFNAAFALAVGIGLLLLAATLIGRGYEAEAELQGRRLVRGNRLPFKRLGAFATAAGATLVSWGATGDGVAMAVLFGALAGYGCHLAYGDDAKADDTALTEAAAKAGVTPERVLAVLDEAHAKIDGIEADATRLRSRELRERLGRIVAQARAVLRQIERNPGDLSRARRFLVTYLDGTRDVVARYAAQQHDLADTELGSNFRRVLDTVEQAFKEQEEVLKRNDRLDLEVKIEVLETQMKREGVH